MEQRESFLLRFGCELPRAGEASHRRSRVDDVRTSSHSLNLNRFPVEESRLASRRVARAE